MPIRWRPALTLTLICSVPAFAAPSDQARRLAELRSEVEQLAARIDEIREESRSTARSSESRRLDLEARLRSEEARLAEITRRQERQRAALADETAAGEVLLPVLVEELTALRAQIARGLPYRIPERLAQVDDLVRQLRAGTLTPQRGALRTWQLLEDELRLTRENVLDRQVIAWRGDETLVDVARIGMVMLYVRTPDGRFGVARREGDRWTYEELTGGPDRAGVGGLFAALDKQIRVGPFELPNALPEVRR